MTAAGRAAAGEPGGTPDELFFGEAAFAATAAIGFFGAGYVVGGDLRETEGTARERGSYALYAAAPLASALVVYAAGERAGVRAANRGAALAATLGVSCAVSGGAAAAAYLLTADDKNAGAVTAGFYSLVPAAFLNALVYNAVKEPYFAEIPGFSLALEPAFGFCPSADGPPVVFYNIGFSF